MPLGNFAFAAPPTWCLGAVYDHRECYSMHLCCPDPPPKLCCCLLVTCFLGWYITIESLVLCTFTVPMLLRNSVAVSSSPAFLGRYMITESAIPCTSAVRILLRNSVAVSSSPAFLG
ncbi:hypothetical protein BDP27DRAFT_1432079 [Rhodocollybia butyracea]|uniref:Uncharacterized protein n=1 Tax=Rhodocollybia butyracea TaxID=206335 RepID=A0A9P5PAT3_9AGAR|nr:hypothetical protein BDP27DRAFT_1432079 [Rhodocollybia butyracea]